MKNNSGSAFHITKKKLSFWDEMRWKWLQFTTRFILFIWGKRDKKLIKKRCMKGWHKFRQARIVYESGTDNEVCINYMECSVCKTICIPNDKDRENYKKMKALDQSRIMKMMKSHEKENEEREKRWAKEAHKEMHKPHIGDNNDSK